MHMVSGSAYIMPAAVGIPGRVSGGTAQSSRAAHIARVKAALLRAAQNTLDAADFTQVVAPTLTSQSGGCGEPGSLISIQLGDKTAFLRQTAQLHLEPL